MNLETYVSPEEDELNGEVIEDNEEPEIPEHLSCTRNSYHDMSPLEVACKYNRQDIVKFFLSKLDLGSSPDAMKHPCKSYNQSLVKMLLEHDLQYFMIIDRVVTEKAITTYILALVELGDVIDFDDFRGKFNESKVLNVFLDLDIFVDQAEKTVEKLLTILRNNNKLGILLARGEKSIFTLVLHSSGVDILAQLWQYECFMDRKL